MDEQIFNNALGRACELMNSEEFNLLVEGKANQRNGKKTQQPYNEFAHFEASAFGEQYSAPTFTNNMVNESKLPSAIRESFENPPPMASQKNINEITLPSAPKQMHQVNNVGVDYSLIKTIIDESVSRCLKEMLNNNDNLLKGIKINGNKITLIDSKNNIYDAELKLRKKK